jgi:ubiquinone/menaquinone biosynthesis C-methylase UbiE
MASVASFAGSVPANYDKYLGPVLFEPYALDIISRIKDAKNVLELACGTGRVTRHLLNKIPADGRLTATDLNPDMIAVAKEIVTSDKVEWRTADAQELPFDDNSFDHIICQFGVMFFPDKAKAMAEAYRLLQPGGTYIFNVWDDLQFNPRSMMIKTIMEDIMGNDAPDFLRKGPYSWFDKNEIRGLLQLTGFKKVELEVVYKTAYYEKAEDLISGFVKGSPLSAYLAEQTEELRNKIVSSLVEKVVSEFGETNLESPMQAIVCTAHKS